MWTLDQSSPFRTFFYVGKVKMSHGNCATLEMLEDCLFAVFTYNMNKACLFVSLLVLYLKKACFPRTECTACSIEQTLQAKHFDIISAGFQAPSLLLLLPSNMKGYHVCVTYEFGNVAHVRNSLIVSKHNSTFITIYSYISMFVISMI